MPYSKLLSNLIESKNLSIKEVAIKCKEYGVNITASYISMIKNSDNKKIPSDEVSRALAKACEAENIETLVIEAYIDKAPIEFRGFLEEYRQIIIQSILMFYTNKVTNEEMQEVIKKMKEMPMAEFILQSTNLSQQFDFDKQAGSFNAKIEMTDDIKKTLLELKEPEGFIIDDNSMYPIIIAGSKVNPQFLPINEYRNGDILLIVIKGSKKPVCRKCLFDETRTKITLMAYDQKIETESYNVKDIAILGKVKRIITELE